MIHNPVISNRCKILIMTENNYKEYEIGLTHWNKIWASTFFLKVALIRKMEKNLKQNISNVGNLIYLIVNFDDLICT